jgi:UDP-N-acetylmuramate dehydrogenase
VSQESRTLAPPAERLREIAGLEVHGGADLAPLTTLRIGGPAEYWVQVTTRQALASLIRLAAAEDLPFELLGMGSNVLVPDEGLAGVTARLGGELADFRCDGDQVIAGGAASLARLARLTASEGRLGLEAFSGFPSTVGGAVVMNAGCYGVEVKDVLSWADVVDARGECRRYDVAELEAGYRSTCLQGLRCVVVEAAFALRRGDSKSALDRVEELNRRRWASLPSGRPNAGSIFRNPAPDYAGRLIESVGLKGATLGGAQISEKHANVIVNLGGARADDVLSLMLLARRRVAEQAGVQLEPEIVLLGSLLDRWREGCGLQVEAEAV